MQAILLFQDTYIIAKLATLCGPVRMAAAVFWRVAFPMMRVWHNTIRRWTPDGALIPLLGIVNHLTHVEWRWIEGGMRGQEVGRSEEEFRPGPELTVETPSRHKGCYTRVASTTVTLTGALTMGRPGGGGTNGSNRRTPPGTHFQSSAGRTRPPLSTT